MKESTVSDASRLCYMQVDIVSFLLETNGEVVVPNRVGSSAKKLSMPKIEVGGRIYAMDWTPVVILLEFIMPVEPCCEGP